MEKSVGKIEIKLMEPADQDGFMEFLKGNLKTFDIFEQLWEWRQENKSISGGEGAAIAKCDGQLVGCVGIVPASINGCGETVRACWQQDSIVDRSMRGKGVGKRLVKKAAEGWDLLLAKGTSEVMHGLRRSVGFVDVSYSRNMVRICRPRKNGLNAKGLAEYLLWLWQTLVLAPKLPGKISVHRVDEFDPSFDAIAESLTHDNVVRLHKNQLYLNWRYVLCPGKDYFIFRAGGDSARGAIVVTTNRSDSEEGWIVDLVCGREDKQCGFALIGEAIRHLNDMGVSRIWVFSTMPSIRRWFMRYGFVPTKFTPRFTYRTANKDIAEKFRTADWDFWHGDGDVELYM